MNPSPRVSQTPMPPLHHTEHVNLAGGGGIEPQINILIRLSTSVVLISNPSRHLLYFGTGCETRTHLHFRVKEITSHDVSNPAHLISFKSTISKEMYCVIVLQDSPFPQKLHYKILRRFIHDYSKIIQEN